MDLNSKPKVIWLSANFFGYELLQKALATDSMTISHIVTLDDKSKTKMYDGVSMEGWNRFGVPIITVQNQGEIEEKLRALSPDFIFVCGWRQMLDNSVLAIPKKGVIGFHPTLLPKGRGPAPIISSILNNLRESGVTMFYLAPGVDSGDIIGQEKFIIEKDDTAEEIYSKVIQCGKILIEKYLPLLAQSRAPRIPQIESEATYFEPRKLRGNEILETDSAERVYAKIRAFSKPYLGAYIIRNGKKIIIWKGELCDGDSA